jgi:4-hydroxy-2-oxoheptanedioate aldolase
VTRIVAAGKPAGILATDEKLAREFVAGGCTFVAVGVDTALLARATSELAARFARSPEAAGVAALATTPPPR